MKLDGIILPRFNNIKADLIYFYPKGLYVNYHISKLYHFEKSKYILLITDQPNKADGLDTMHGFMIFRIENDN
jgi:hypothetical protein